MSTRSGSRDGHSVFSRSNSVATDRSGRSRHNSGSFISNHSRNSSSDSRAFDSFDEPDEQNDDTIVAAGTKNAHFFSDKLSKDLVLSSKQAAELHKLVGLGRTFQGDELLFRLTEIANSYKTQNLLEKVLDKCTSTEVLVRSLNVSTTTKWKADEDQNNNLLALVKEIIFKAAFWAYSELGHISKRAAEDRAAELKFEDVFKGSAKVLQIFDRELAAKCRNVKGQLKGHIKEFTFGSKRLTFDKFCEDLSIRYSKKGFRIKVTKEIKDRLYLLRRFARMHPDAVGAEDDEDEDQEDNPDSPILPESISDEHEESNHTRSLRRQSSKASASKKRKRSEGRTPTSKKKSWWSMVDQWLAELKTEFGEDMNGALWQNFLSETYELEKQSLRTNEQFASYGQILGHAPSQDGGIQAATYLPRTDFSQTGSGYRSDEHSRDVYTPSNASRGPSPPPSTQPSRNAPGLSHRRSQSIESNGWQDGNSQAARFPNGSPRQPSTLNRIMDFPPPARAEGASSNGIADGQGHDFPHISQAGTTPRPTMPPLGYYAQGTGSGSHGSLPRSFDGNLEGNLNNNNHPDGSGQYSRDNRYDLQSQYPSF